MPPVFWWVWVWIVTPHLVHFPAALGAVWPNAGVAVGLVSSLHTLQILYSAPAPVQEAWVTVTVSHEWFPVAGIVSLRVLPQVWHTWGWTPGLPQVAAVGVPVFCQECLPVAGSAEVFS